MVSPTRKAGVAGAGAAGRTHEGARSSEEMTTTAIHIPKATLSLLRRVAVARADLRGGRPSVSGVIAELVEKNRAELERETGR